MTSSFYRQIRSTLLKPTADELAELRQIFAPNSSDDEWRDLLKGLGIKTAPTKIMLSFKPKQPNQETYVGGRDKALDE